MDGLEKKGFKTEMKNNNMKEVAAPRESYW